MPTYFGVDIGNSGLKAAVLNLETAGIGPTCRISWRHSQPAGSASPAAVNADPRYLPSEPDWLHALAEFASAHSTASHEVTWVLGSVRRDAQQLLLEWVANQPGHQLYLPKHSDLGLEVQVDFPNKVGMDRLLAASAACVQSDARPIIVIQAGSAVTIDLVKRTGSGDAFCGGAILPGVPMMLRLLGQGADSLPEIEADDLTELPELPGKNTEAAMACGAASALVGGTQHLVQRYRNMFGANTPVVISGGDGTRLVPFLPGPTIVKDHLVQLGLLEFIRKLENSDD